MSDFQIYPSVDENYNFPIEVKRALTRRYETELATSSLAENAVWSSTVDLAKSYRLLHISTSVPARVRMYATVAQQIADVDREIGTDPVGDHGLMFEYVTVPETLSAILSPTVDGVSFELVPSIVPISITNLSATNQVVGVILIYMITEF